MWHSHLSKLLLLEDALIRKLQNIVRVIRRSTGSCIYEEGDSALECFFLLEGEVKLFKRIRRGGALCLLTLRAGDIFGIVEILAHHQSYITSACVLQDALLIGIPRQELVQLLKESKPFSQAVVQKLAEYGTQLLSKIMGLIELSLPQRLARELLNLVDHYGKAGDDGSMKIMRLLTNEELAERIGTIPETVSTLLRPLKQRGIIKRKGRQFVLLRREELERLAQ